MYDLNGKIAIVTGAGGRHGIGRAIATRLASEGANVVVTDVPQSLDAIRDEDRLAGWEGLHSVAAEIEAMGRESLGIFSDVSDSDQVDDMVGQTLAKFGRIDILVNNAGSRPGKDRVLVVELEEEAFDEVMRVNVRGTLPGLPRGGQAYGGTEWWRQNHQHLFGGGQTRHRQVRRLLRLQVRGHRLHAGHGPGNGPAPGQRKRNLPGPGRH